MQELEKYVDTLFSKYKETNNIKEQKDEILSNLEAKMDDGMESGMSYNEAVEFAIKSIDTIDFLIDTNQLVYINQYKIDLIQTGFIYTLIIWILTIPLRITYFGEVINTLLTTGVVVYLIVYIFIFLKKSSMDANMLFMLDTAKIMKYRKYAWIIWGFYFLVKTGCTTAIRFGSNIWFMREVRIDGPYQFAVIVLDYIIPLVTIIVPMIFSRAYKIIGKYEVKK